MATVRILKNILEEKVDTFFVEEGTTVEQIIRHNTKEDVYDGLLVECYDTETGTTFFSPIEEDETAINAIVQVNGKDKSLDYSINENDVVTIIITPAGGTSVMDWGFVGAIVGAFIGAVAVAVSGGALAPIVLGAISGAGAGWLLATSIAGMIIDESGTTTGGLTSQKLPDVRGATNQVLLDQCYPFVLGKHLVSPFIIGSPWNEISGDRGQTNYIHCLYAVGYAPLRLTDFKLGEMYLAHNQRWNGNNELENIFHGALHGIDTETGSGEDKGDIVSTWANNDVTIEILQQGQNGEAVDYGTVYPYAKIQEDIKANVLYIADGTLGDIDRGNNISYKGLGLRNGLRNNPVRFTEQFPRTIKVELDFANGLYKTRSETNNNNSTVKYYKIPLWTAIQWRVYSEKNDTTDGSVGGELAIPEYDYTTKSYVSQKRGWISFDTVNGNINSTEFSLNNRNSDIDAHTGNDLKIGGVYTDINEGWIGSKVFNLQSLGGTNQEPEGVNEIRCVTSVDLIQWARDNLLTEQEQGDEDILIEKIKAYFYDGSNTTRSVEVRVVRVSPCYIDEQTSTQEHSAFKFNDVFTWSTLTSEMIDGDELMVNNNLVSLRPLTEERMRKLCIVSLKAKTDNIDQLSNTIKQFSCMAQSFAPYYDEENKTWIPESVNKITKYYKPPVQIGPKEWQEGEEITEEQFYTDRQNGIKSQMVPSGNDFVSNLVNNVIRIQNHIDGKGRYFIPYDDMSSGSYEPECDGTLNYCTNNVASMFLLAGIGPMAGVDALGYEQSFYENGELKQISGDFNMRALADWACETKELKDGSYYSSDGYHYDYKGNYIHHSKGEEVKVYFAANAYLYNTETLENIFSKIAAAGRAVYTRDNKNRLTVVMDKPEKYPVALINQQNCLSSSYNLTYSELPSGLQLSFQDETDGYETNSFYCMVDGENVNNPKKAIEQYQFPYVTNAYQQNSLGRYLLANRILNKEAVVKKIGIEGASINLGDLIVVQDETMLIGTDTGGRIIQIIATNNNIYGFIINNTFYYTGEEETYIDGNNQEQTRCVQGVVVLQPSKYKESRLITLRLAKVNTVVRINEKDYVLKKGNTNIVIFDTPISAEPNANNYFVFTPQIENLVSFGIVGSITSTYRVIKIKPDNKHNYELTLSKYQKELYNYGRALPSFQNNMTVPDRSKEDFYPLSDVIKNSDLAKIEAQTTTQIQGVVDGIFGQVPSVPQFLTANVTRDGIDFSCAVETNEVNNIDYVLYEITRYRNNNGVVEEDVVTLKDLYTATYNFNRNWEGYPEKKNTGVVENDGSLDFWKFRAKTVSIYVDRNGQKIQSNWSDYVNISAASLERYGTWKIPDIVVSTEVVDRTVILTAVRGGSPKELYGTLRTKVLIKRIGNITPIETGSQTSFNEYLGITSDSEYFTPEFNRSVSVVNGVDNEPNYCIKYPEVTTIPEHPTLGDVVRYIGTTTEDFENGKYYRFNGVDWSEYSIWYESLSYKITHTLPLIGQTSRIFNRNEYTEVFTKDVITSYSIAEYSEVPVVTLDKAIMLYKGTTTSDFENGKYYIYDSISEEWDEITNNFIFYYMGGNTIVDGITFAQKSYYMFDSAWQQVISKINMVPTTYMYKIQMTNESGNVSNIVEIPVDALCTNLADIVHSHEHYKVLYVEKLSALSANMGLIKQGGMGAFDDEDMLNCWALSDLSPEDSGTENGVMKGTFRVGDKNEYFRVTPYQDPDYPNDPTKRKFRIELKAGNIEFSTDVGGNEVVDFQNGTYIYNGERTVRLKLAPDGIVVQKYIGQTIPPNWTDKNNFEDVSEVYCDSKGNMIISNTSDVPEFGVPVSNATIYHFDDGTSPQNDENGNNPYNITIESGSVVPTTTEGINHILLPVSSKGCFQGSITTDMSTYLGNIVFYTKSNLIIMGDKVINHNGVISDNNEATYYNDKLTETIPATGQPLYQYLGLSTLPTNLFKNLY